MQGTLHQEYIQLTEARFFDEKHPDFPAGKRFIITHLAAAYANGSSDWASGTNATGKNLAMELYNYCVNMPDIPSVDMSFSESNVKAYVEGNSQRTSVITFKADKLQTITFKLPSGVKLVNVTTGKTSAAGASVEISGGTQFYLTAPLDQAESVSVTFSSRMKGSIDKEYSAYKIVTGSGTQDLALVFGEGVGNEKYVDFKVTWTKECKVSIVKKDQDTGNALAGAVYGIYSDAACTKLIAEMPATDQNGASQLTMEKTQEVVYLKEISVPTGYQIDTKSYNVTLAIGKTTTKNATDKRTNAKLNIAKQDAETGNEAQGDATLEGAVYGLYAREDIVHPDGRTGTIYKIDTLITSLTTDKNGEASVSDLYLGKYYLKELSAPVGYVLDPTEHDVDCTYEGATVPTVERTSVCKETVVKQPFQIIKAANNGKMVIVEHFDMIYPLLHRNADLLVGIGEEIIITRPSMFGPLPENIAGIVHKSVKYRKMAHTLVDLCVHFMGDGYALDGPRSDVRHGFVLEFEEKPDIDLYELEEKVRGAVAKDLSVSYYDEKHVQFGDWILVCLGPRMLLSSTGKIEDFTLVKEYPVDPRTGYYMLIGLMGKHQGESLKDFNRIEVKNQLK